MGKNLTDPPYDADYYDINSPGISAKEVAVGAGRLVNFNYILETGKNPAARLLGSSTLIDGLGTIMMGPTNQSIDWDSDDAFTQAIEQIKNRVSEEIEKSSSIQNLLAKSSWNKADREVWEETIAKLTSQEMDKIPGLDDYRTEKSGTAEKRVKELNDISADIKNNTQKLEVDCEVMSDVEGCVLQQLENELLPEDAPDGDFKAAFSYFYASASVSWDSKDEPGAHAFIMSGATGNVIEATNDPSVHSVSPYKKSTDPDWSLQDFIKGKIFTATGGLLFYGPDTMTLNDVKYHHVYGDIDPSWASFSSNQSDMVGVSGQKVVGSIPEEVQELAKIKALIGRLKEMDNSHYNINENDLRAQFNGQILECIENGTISRVTNFLEQEGQLNNTLAPNAGGIAPNAGNMGETGN